MHRSSILAALAGALILAGVAPAATSNAGSYKGKIDYQGYDITFKVKGYIREWDTVEGSGIVCDTLKRTFTATRR
jgi:hypothetical protein